MDRASVIGLIFGTAVLIASVMVNGVTKVFMFYDTASILIVLGGASASMFISYPLSDLFALETCFRKTLFNRKESPIDAITLIVSLADTARREGLLSLENRMQDIDDPFIASGIRMAIDGLAPEIVEAVMNTEIDAVNARHLYNRSLVSNLGKYAPSFGMIGTLIGLILMMADFNPESIGQAMAVCLITTLYGAILSNLYFLPMADKLGFLNDFEIRVKEIAVKGIVAIQAGENPRVIKQKLMTYVPPTQRPDEEEENF
ncbi:MAG: MotA/TolQ/ExbB proton channel family protein [Planctomycetaceae bacterium]|jgi:chemotaxis protein MotA|nr:MotA/TolQ/ExbB proton channel family protein [Planctomycetaceae bacterium]